MDRIKAALERARDTKALISDENASSRAGEMFRELFPDMKAVIVADSTTWEKAGRTVQKSLDEAGIRSEAPFIFRSSDLYAEWEHVETLRNYLQQLDCIAVAVGSGVINDLTKYVSYLSVRKYICVGTAASMDGFTAYGASISKDGNKQTFDCPGPYGFIMDTSVAAQAPKELAASGYADLIAKIPAGADWMLADAAGIEKIDGFTWDIVQGSLHKAIDSPEAICSGDMETTKALADGLLLSGFAMQAIQSSRPASGTEHQYSHCWDMEDLCHEGKHVSHGFKVGIGTLASTAGIEFIMRKGLENIDIDRHVNDWKSWESIETEIYELFHDKPAHLNRCLTESRNKYVGKEELREQLARLSKAWPGLKPQIQEQMIPFRQIRENLKKVGAPYEPEMIGISRERLRQTVRYIPYMRSRFTNIDVIYRLGWMEEFIESLFGKGGIWEISI